MRSFLITFKPATENPTRGWPLKNLQALIERLKVGEQVQERWRFHNRKLVEQGDRVFLLQQGKQGPAIIGYGSVVNRPDENSDGRATIHFEFLVDPSEPALVSREELFKITQKKQIWSTQASGVLLPEGLAAELESRVRGLVRTDGSGKVVSNPDWSRDELILALDVYLLHRPNPPSKTSDEILDLSTKLNQLGELLFPPEKISSTFRNINGVYMKLMNFRRLDPLYITEGRKGLTRGAKIEEEVWAEFADDPERCRQVADAIMLTLNDPEVNETWFKPDEDGDLQEAPEGRLLTRKHLTRERNGKLVESKKKQAAQKYGVLACEVCNFDFAARYGERGRDFIECHHTKPISTLTEGHKTHIDDLALICANCHRMLHRSRPWLSIVELRTVLESGTSMGLRAKTPIR